MVAMRVCENSHYESLKALSYITNLYGVGAITAAQQAAWQAPNAVLHATINIGTVAPTLTPHVNPAAV
jgi:hypothetical protein